MDLSRLTDEERNRYLILRSTLAGMLYMDLDDIIDCTPDKDIYEEIEYLEKLAEGKISRDAGKTKSLKPSKHSQKNKKRGSNYVR